ncbi:LCP family protein [Shimazuella kribbensis]|uniref:LCP family protein n=1 Tax=Shimazuella kribbensis TaxID=139808 RepID=UPI000408484F|nr:LCP family protein [Shimazuella kribbensis]
MMERVEHSRKKRVDHKKRKKWVLRISLFSLVAILIVGIYFVGTIWGALTKGHDSDQEKSKFRTQEVDINKDPFTVLFIGTDQFDTKAEAETYRTDVLMVAAVNPQKKTIKLVNIPRDTYAEIANTEGFKTKINSAAYWGKQKGINPIQNTRETVETLLYGVPIDYYVKINFKGFIDIVNAVGGIDVNVPMTFRISTFDRKVQFYKGPMHLSGEEALPYVRMRKEDPQGDHGRNKRQQEVINKILDKIVSFNSISNFSKITDAVGNNLSYSINPNEFLSLATIYKNTPKNKIETLTAKVEDKKVSGVWYSFMQESERKRISTTLKEVLGLPTTDNGEVDSENGSGENGQP